ncbi:MAG: Stp1/IreP family PP2C-type Ser/Thr phosphatase [Clostridia bacterium]|nr:Stp1/IreP family PP2C-type Ser/Thr phosphatase [Clostridia bacterium]
MRCCGITDIGKVRELNEDSFAIKTIQEYNIVVAVVADGMGGHNAGEVASVCATDTMIALVEDAAKYFKNYSDKQICDFLKNAVNKINKIIYNKASESQNMSGMGTTVVCCIVYNNKCYIANVGDSRLYKFNKQLTQITKDHSYVWELVQMGVITNEQAKDHPNKNVITKAVGTEKTVIPDTFIEKIKSGDYFLLCSDGLVNMVSDDDITKVMLNDSDIKDKVTTLVELAKENGGKDNITLVMLKSETEA